MCAIVVSKLLLFIWKLSPVMWPSHQLPSWTQKWVEFQSETSFLKWKSRVSSHALHTHAVVTASSHNQRGEGCECNYAVLLMLMKSRWILLALTVVVCFLAFLSASWNKKTSRWALSQLVYMQELFLFRDTQVFCVNIRLMCGDRWSKHWKPSLHAFILSVFFFFSLLLVLQARWRHDRHPFRSGTTPQATSSNMLKGCKKSR